MSFSETDIKATIKDYVLNEFLPGENPDSLDATTPLISGGVLDSIGLVKLVGFLEYQFGIRIEPHEMNADFMDSLADIETLVRSRLKSS